MQTIADASSLIVLSRLNVLWLVERVYGVVGITEPVAREVVEAGKAGGYRNAAEIEAAIRAGVISVLELTPDETKAASERFAVSPSLSRADWATIVLARQRGWVLLIEDLRARRAAAAEGVTCMTIQALPLLAYIRHEVGLEQCASLLVEVASAMHTDPVWLEVLLASAREIGRLRGERSAP